MKTENNNTEVMEKDNFLEDLNKPVSNGKGTATGTKAEEIKASEDFQALPNDNPLSESNDQNAGPLFSTSTDIAKANSEMATIFEEGDLPDLDDVNILPFELIGSYWKPTSAGDFKNVYFDKISTIDIPDSRTGEIKPLECAFFFEKSKGKITSWMNGSSILVNEIKRNNIQRLNTITITYKGTKQSKKGNNCSDWSIQYCMPKA